MLKISNNRIEEAYDAADIKEGDQVTDGGGIMYDFYKKMIGRYIESKEMRNYLIGVANELSKRQIIDLICGARADLRDKYESLLRLSEFESDKQKKEDGSAYERAQKAKKNLDELALKKGEVFCNMEYMYDYERAEKAICGASPHFFVNSVMKYVHEEYEELDEQEKTDATYWYRLKKYTPDNDIELDWCYAYTIAPNGEIWFCRDIKNHKDNCFDDSQDLNLPVPFEIGDIITIDCRPFTPVKHGVIVEKGDNRDCCCVQCAWINEEGQVKTGALKHTTVFFDKSFVRISPLYRAEVFEGELPHEEQPLKETSESVCREEEKNR